MAEGDRYIAGVPCWVDLTQPDPEAAMAFYGGVFGWTFEEVGPGYHSARLDGGDVAGLGAPQPGAPSSSGWQTYVWTEDAAATAAAAQAAGGQVLAAPFDTGPAGRMAVLADPAGAELRLWQPAKHRGATVVNEPGSVNFNTLHAHDLAGARAFYGAVFGWELLLDGLLGAPRLRRLPRAPHARPARAHAPDGRPRALRGVRRRRRRRSRATTRRTGASRSPSRTPTPPPRAPSSWAGRSPRRPSTRRGCA